MVSHVPTYLAIAEEIDVSFRKNFLVDSGSSKAKERTNKGKGGLPKRLGKRES